MWFKRKPKNRRLTQSRVLDVKLRSSQVRIARLRLAAFGTGLVFGTVFALYVLWRAGGWALDRLVYENRSFAIQEIVVVNEGVISPEQLRRWSGVRRGQNLLKLDLANVKRELEMVSCVQSVSVERILPGTLRIRVVEREPIAQINVPRPRPDQGIDLVVFQIDAEGWVMRPLDPRQRSVPLNEARDGLPVLAGLNVSELQPGRKIDLPQARAALRWIQAFQSSPMNGQVDLKRVDVSSPSVLVAATSQGSEITFGLDHFEQQLARWQAVHQLGAGMNKVIATLDLAVTNNVPARWLEAGAFPPAAPRNANPQRNRRRNV